jgi:hypothetical protein
MPLLTVALDHKAFPPGVAPWYPAGKEFSPEMTGLSPMFLIYRAMVIVSLFFLLTNTLFLIKIMCIRRN